LVLPLSVFTLAPPPKVLSPLARTGRFHHSSGLSPTTRDVIKRFQFFLPAPGLLKPLPFLPPPTFLFVYTNSTVPAPPPSATSFLIFTIFLVPVPYSSCSRALSAYCVFPVRTLHRYKAPQQPSLLRGSTTYQPEAPFFSYIFHLSLPSSPYFRHSHPRPTFSSTPGFFASMLPPRATPPF